MDNEQKALAMDGNGQLYLAHRAMALIELNEQFEKLANHRDMIPVEEIRELLHVEVTWIQ